MNTVAPVKPFIARGSRIERCPRCLLGQRACICEYKIAGQAEACFVLLMHHNERFKPTNTGRLIADCFSDTKIFEWSRTEPAPEFLQLLQDVRYQPYLVFPEGDDYQHRMVTYDGSQKRPLFILLDGTWRQARRMFRHSSYLQGLPVITLPELPSSSRYHLRKAVEPGQLCTAEVAAELLAMIGDGVGAEVLMAYFEVFNEHYRAARLSRPLNEEMPAKGFLRQLLELASDVEHKGHGTIIDQADLHVSPEAAAGDARVQ